MAQLIGILETCLYVDDLAAAEAFYHDALGCEFVSRKKNRHVFFRVGKQMLLLFNPSQSHVAEKDVPPHGATGPGHIAFAIEPHDLSHWRDQLAQHNVVIESEVTWPCGSLSLYFRDPEGNSLEVTSSKIWE